MAEQTRATRVRLATGYQPQTAAEALERIAAGTTPWVAFGDFLDDWRRTPVSQRLLLVEDPLSEAESPELRRWSALFAAAIEYLCWYNEPSRLTPPAWTVGGYFVLPEPWFLYLGESLRAMQLFETPAAFKAHNIFGGSHILDRV